MRILVVEDNYLLAASLATTLADAGHEVVGPAASIDDALQLAEVQPPELALLDIELQGGGSGVDLARELLLRWNLPCLFVSGTAEQARANQDLALGYVPKPYGPETVLASVEVAKLLGDGKRPESIPGGLELFAGNNTRNEEVEQSGTSDKEADT